MARVVTDITARVHIDATRDDVGDWLANEIAADARRLAPVDTSFLSTHIDVFPGVGPGRREVVALGAGTPPNDDAPAYVEYGTEPHLIVSHGPWPLRNARTGQTFGRVVHHPGTPAQPFMRPAAYTKRVIPPWVVKARSSWSAR